MEHRRSCLPCTDKHIHAHTQHNTHTHRYAQTHTSIPPQKNLRLTQKFHKTIVALSNVFIQLIFYYVAHMPNIKDIKMLICNPPFVGGAFLFEKPVNYKTFSSFARHWILLFLHFLEILSD